MPLLSKGEHPEVWVLVLVALGLHCGRAVLDTIRRGLQKTESTFHFAVVGFCKWRLELGFAGICAAIFMSRGAVGATTVPSHPFWGSILRAETPSFSGSVPAVAFSTHGVQ